MSIHIEGIGKQKISYKDPKDIDFSSLNDYVLLAKKSISKFSNSFYRGLSSKMLKDEDAISNIANAIMMADWRFDENYGTKTERKTRYSYRNQCAIWAIQSYVTKNYRDRNRKHKIYSLDYSKSENEEQSGYAFVNNSKSKNPEEILIKKEEEQLISDKINEIFGLSILSDKQKQYCALYYLDGYTFEQIGHKYGLTREAIRQSIKKTIEKVKEYYNVKV
jgi:RNA polymerase sigma factor (sigma-70 family)